MTKAKKSTKPRKPESKKPPPLSGSSEWARGLVKFGLHIIFCDGNRERDDANPAFKQALESRRLQQDLERVAAGKMPLLTYHPDVNQVPLHIRLRMSLSEKGKLEIAPHYDMSDTGEVFDERYNREIALAVPLLVYSNKDILYAFKKCEWKNCKDKFYLATKVNQRHCSDACRQAHHRDDDKTP